jgi:histidinol-phosphate aminotransferase
MTIQFLKNLDNIEPYIGGMPIEELSRKIGIPEDKIIKLASNENPYGISPTYGSILSRFFKNCIVIR